jgi:hypothetical protein
MPEIIAAACSSSAGVSEDYSFRGLDDRSKEIAASKSFRGMGLHQAMYMIAQANSIPFTPGRVDSDFIRALYYHSNQQMIQAAAGGGGFSTMSLSGLMENILNKYLLQSYDMADSVVDDICWSRDTNDFKIFKSYRMTAVGTMEEVGPDGELNNMSLQDETYQNQLKTRGGILNIGRDKIMNDDLSAITQSPQAMVELAMTTREKVVFQLLALLKTTVAPGASINQTANAFNFISTGAGNYLTGASSALGITSMATARQKFREQKDANGNFISNIPDRVLITTAIETAADNLFQGANIVVGALGSTSSKSTEPNLNAHKGKYTPIVSPWFGAASPAGTFTDTNWMLLGNPSSGKAPVQIGYLRGQRKPTIERGECNFNTLGMALRLFYDFGVAAHDYRSAVWSDGQ